MGGICLLSGKSPCYSSCPDLCDEYFSSGPCLTPTPTPTLPCDVDFEAVFDCQYPPTPSVTPTHTTTPTPSVTPTETPACVLTVVYSVNSYSPTPTPTNTPTPTTTPQIVRPCDFLGNVTYNVVDELIKCPISQQFQDCFNGLMYYTTNNIIPPVSGTTLEQFMVFEASVNGESRCISYVGLNTNVIGADQITLQYGPFGYSNLGECVNCTPFVSPSMTPTTTSTSTPTPTPTLTPTPTQGLQQPYFVFTSCDNKKLKLVQTSPSITTTPGDVVFDSNLGCWEFDFMTYGYPNLNPTDSVINYSGNYLPNVISQIFESCTDCKNRPTNPAVPSSIYFPNTGEYVKTSTSIPVGTSCSDGGSPITSNVIYYSTTNNPPTPADNSFTIPAVSGGQVNFVTGLSPSTGYYFSYYASNINGTNSISYPAKVYTI